MKVVINNPMTERTCCTFKVGVFGASSGAPSCAWVPPPLTPLCVWVLVMPASFCVQLTIRIISLTVPMSLSFESPLSLFLFLLIEIMHRVFSISDCRLSQSNIHVSRSDCCFTLSSSSKVLLLSMWRSEKFASKDEIDFTKMVIFNEGSLPN